MSNISRCTKVSAKKLLIITPCIRNHHCDLVRVVLPQAAISTQCHWQNRVLVFAPIKITKQLPFMIR